MFLTIPSLLGEQASVHPDQPAILDLERPALDFAGLCRLITGTTARLNDVGILRGDRVAVVLPNGPVMATCFLAVSSAATCAPLNPGYRSSEFEFYLSDLKARALVVEAGSDSPSIMAAKKLGLEILRISQPANGRAGEFLLESEAGAGERQNPLNPLQNAGWAVPPAHLALQPLDVALILHTSGTTSRPKIVPLTHANLCHSAAHIRRTLALSPGDLCMNVMPLFHIHGLIGALLSSLSAGAAVACTPGFSSLDFFAWFATFRPTWFTAVPTMHQALLARAGGSADALRGSRLRFVRSSSAPLPPRAMAALEATFGVPVIEAYGMTEASHQMASNPLPPGSRKPGSVGPAAGPEIAIMDSAGNLLPAGSQGEVVIRGCNVIAAYESNPKANHESFANGWFRTGDQGRLDEDGYLFLSGRIKEIINRGGEKISPREIDDVLMEHPAIVQAVTFAVPDERLGEEVGAAVVLRPGAVVGELEIQEFAAARLADFKIPRHVVLLPEIPKGPTGKPQRIGLAARLGVTSSPAESRKSPGSSALERTVEKRLVEIWSEVLRTSDIGLETNFFDLGGDSLLAAQLIARVRSAFGCRLSLPQFFRLPTLARMADWLQSDALETAKDEPIPVSTAEVRRLSFAEERIWFLNEYEQDKWAYVRPSGFRLSGRLDAEALRRAIHLAISRHEAVRTSYTAGPELCARVLPVPVEFELPLIDLSGLPSERWESELRRLAREESRAPFDLTGDLLLRVRLIRLAEEQHVLFLSTHHIAFDGWSDTVLFRELSEAYRALTGQREPLLPPLRLKYGDYAEWQRCRLTREAKQDLVQYWENQLAGLAPLLPFPLDHGRPSRQTYCGANEYLALDPDLVEAVKQLSRRQGVTVFTSLLAVFGVLLGRYSGVEDFAIGTPVTGRPTAETEKLIGCFSNTLILRLNLKDDPTGLELLDRTRQTVLEALDHQDLPFEVLVETLNPSRSLSYHPLVQIMFQLRNLPDRALILEGLRTEEMRWDLSVCPLDLSLDLIETDEGLTCKANYNSDLFEKQTICRFLNHYKVLLSSFARTPEKRLSDLEMLNDSERRRLLVDFNATAQPGADVAVAGLFEQTAAARPDGMAIECEGSRLCYSELNRRANQLAACLRARGVKPGDRVATWLERSPESVVSLLALLKIGAVYVPLDINYPPERARFILEDATVSLILTVSALEGGAPRGVPTVCVDRIPSGPDFSAENPGFVPDLDAPAFVMYTSGSTGKPKGVVLLQRGLANSAFWLRKEFASRRTDTVHAAALTFDMSLFEVLLPLLTGGTLVIVTDRTRRDPDNLVRELNRSRPAGLAVTPSNLRVLLDSGVFDRAESLEWVHSGGEALSSELARRLLSETRIDLVNMYGPTETCIVTHTCWLDRETLWSVPIGRPIPNTTAYVLGPRMELLPIGVTGELYLGGQGVARGYLNQPDLTAHHFVPDPFGDRKGARLYRTGDLVRFRSDGLLEYRGRTDDQVKVRGYRIETGEIESLLLQHPLVGQAAVVAQTFGPDDRRLVAYVSTKAATDHLDERCLRDYLSALVPPYMVPFRLVSLDALPIAPSGKVERSQLILGSVIPTAERDRSRRPSDRTEETLAQLWEELLKVGPIGLDDDFFDLGGHSLLAVRLFAEIERRFGRRLPLATLFQAPTISGLAARLRSQANSNDWKSLVPIQPRGEYLPLFFIHGVEGEVLFYGELALLLGSDQPVFALRARGLDGCACLATFEEMAAEYLGEIRSVQASGPYFLAGFCTGAYIAFEMARQLTAAGQTVAFLGNCSTDATWKTISSISGQLRYHRQGMAGEGAVKYLSSRLVQRSKMMLAGSASWFGGRLPGAQPWLRKRRVRAANRSASVAYKASAWPGRMTYFMGEGDRHRDPAPYWKPLVLGGLDIRLVPGSQMQMFRQPQVQKLAESLSQCLAVARRGRARTLPYKR